MNAVSLTGLLASFSGVAMALSPLLQARRIHTIRDSSEVSQAFFLVLLGNACVWFAHGLATGDLVLLIPNAVAIFATAGTFAIVRRHRHGPHAPALAPASAPSVPAPEAVGSHRSRAARVRGGAVALASPARRKARARH